MNLVTPMKTVGYTRGLMTCPGSRAMSREVAYDANQDVFGLRAAFPQGILPGTRFKSRLISRLLGVTMGENVGIAYAVMFDPYDPSMISIGDNVIIGTETRIFVHTFMLNRQRVRPVTIGSNVQIGAFCVIAPGVTIGDGVSIAPCTLVSRSIPPGAIVTGNQMNITRRPS